MTGGDGAIGEVVYYENDGNENFKKQMIDDTPGNRQRCFIVDIDHDDDPDLKSIQVPSFVLLQKFSQEQAYCVFT